MIAELGIMAEEQGPSQVHNILQMVKKEQGNGQNDFNSTDIKFSAIYNF